VAARARRRIENIYRQRLQLDEWYLSYHLAPEATGAPELDVSRFTPIRPPRDAFYADPFAVQDGERYFVFFEEYIRRAGRARISVAEISLDGGVGVPRPVLECPYHLSYPFVFYWRDDWYMVPESSEVERVDLYRARRFPDEWELVCTLLEGVRACDATLWEQGGTWWLFATLAAEHAPTDEELYLYHAPSPLGPWTPHAENPVKSDVRGARPAGPLFRQGTALIRPGQDGSGGYGSSVRLFRVESLGPTHYAETEIGQLRPDANLGMQRLHMLSHAGRLTVIDSMTWRPRWR